MNNYDMWKLSTPPDSEPFDEKKKCKYCLDETEKTMKVKKSANEEVIINICDSCLTLIMQK